MHGLKLNITTSNPNKTWIEFALTHMTVFHVTLAFAAATWNASIAMPFLWLTRAGYYHKGVAIHLVNEQLNYSPTAASDEVICAVASLVNVEVCTRGNPLWLNRTCVITRRVGEVSCDEPSAKKWTKFLFQIHFLIYTIFQTLSGDFDARRTHLKGLISLVEARGGIKNLKDNFIVERTITWFVHIEMI